ncbi:hypothetical protein GCM10023339_64190 [Alloalcanivorax gelatiniphagus]
MAAPVANIRSLPAESDFSAPALFQVAIGGKERLHHRVLALCETLGRGGTGFVGCFASTDNKYGK